MTAIVLALRSLIKTESRTAKLRQVVTLPRFSLQMNQRMNEHLSLLFCSLPACPLLILSFQVFAFEKKSFSMTLHVLALKFQGTWMVPSDDPFLRKQTSEKALKPNSNDSLCEIFLNIFANQRKEESLATPFFLRSIPSELHLELNSRSFFLLYRSLSLFYSRCAPFRPENVPKPVLPPYRSPLSAVSSTCKEITWEKCYGSVCLALFTESLTKQCSLKLCARQMAMSSQ